MKLKDGTILMHGTVPYDPVKAHEYYMRTRQLKGRKRGSVSSPTYSVALNKGKTITLNQKQLIEQRTYAAKRVSEIKQRLSELSTKLREMKREAQKKKVASTKKPTAADKSKAARESKQYQKKHKQELSNKDKKSSTEKSATKDPVAELQSKITEVKGRLKATIETQRALFTAKKNV